MDSEDDKRLPQIDSWSVRDGQSRHTLDVSIHDVTLEEISPSPYAGGGMSGTHQEFLEGKFHDDVRRIFGERVLQEALAVARRNSSLRRSSAN
jgi:hypothetical protein